ncbi:hypothetical protein SEPCBS119000_004831 [Sporothrix epigloea]|uniref:Zn(2)-C6 fungal-type domain-containing protein n=1 Tax=Sporothrix epigloea TaxID=1892477 RepID=A0ABP0DY47_9PEZI
MRSGAGSAAVATTGVASTSGDARLPQWHQPQKDQTHGTKSLQTQQTQYSHSQSPSRKQQQSASSDSGDGDDGDERSDVDDDHDGAGSRTGKRKRLISVSCELCKQRKVKCDRGQPACGWCTRNGAACEYKERKKPGLRAGYGRELEARLDKLEAVLRRHSEVLHITFDAAGQPVGPPAIKAPPPNLPNLVALNNGQSGSVHSTRTGTEDRSAPQDHAMTSAMFGRVDTAQTPQAEAALFLQKPSTFSFSSGPGPAPTGGAPAIPGRHGSVNGSDIGMVSPSAINGSGGNGAAYGPGSGPISGISPSHHAQSSPLPTPTTRDYFGASARQGVAGSGTVTSSPLTNMAAGSKSLLGSDQDLPPYDLSYALVDLYFKHINTWCPLLQRIPTIEALFGAGMTDETNNILLHAIVATTLRFSTDARLTEEKRQRYYNISKNRVLLYGMQNMSVKALQAMVILALDFCGSSNGPPSWNMMALITRAVVQLGLAVEATANAAPVPLAPSYASVCTFRAIILPAPKDFAEEELRRRLFWVVYLLDRYATMTSASDFTLDDRDIDRSLPCRDDLWTRNQKVETRLLLTDHLRGSINEGPGSLGANGFEPEAGGPSGFNGKPENLGAFSYYMEILGILTKIHHFLKQPVDISSLTDVEQWQMRYRELDQTLNSWKAGLPSEYGNMAKLFQPNGAKAVTCGWIMLHMTYRTATIRLHASSAYPTTRSPIFAPSYSASQRCQSAVENMAQLCEFAVANNLLSKLGPPFAFSLWVAARLYLVHGSTVEHKLNARVYFLVDTLRAMGRYWPVAGRYCALLQRVLDECGDSERQGDQDHAPPQSPPPLTTIQVLAHMRRTAFDLDLLLNSQQPPHGASGHGFFGGPSLGHYAHDNRESSLGRPGAAMISHTMSRLPGHAPAQAQTPQPKELDYLEVFDFFNVPRLPFGFLTDSGSGSGSGNRMPMVSGMNNGPPGSLRHHAAGDATDSGSGAAGNSRGDAADSGTSASISHRIASSQGGHNGGGDVTENAVAATANANGDMSFGNDFNMTDFVIDANRDWLYKQDRSGKFTMDKF